MPDRRRFMLVAACAGAMIVGIPSQATIAIAQDKSWPQRTVRLILPLGPGSGADIGARLIAEKLTAKWGQPVVVENRPGGDGFIAINAFINARDGHTLLFAPASSFTAHPYLHKKVPYNAKELSPIAQVSLTLVSVTIAPSVKANTLKEFFDLVRANPGKYNWATITGVTDLVVDAFLRTNKLDMAKVPYKNPVQALGDVAEGRLHFYIAAYAITRAQVAANRVRLVAVTASEPAEALPDVPTVAQAGFPDLTFDGLVGVFGPPDMASDLRDRISRDVIEAVKDPGISKKLTATGQVVQPADAKTFAASIEQQREAAAKIGQILGIKPAQ